LSEKRVEKRSVDDVFRVRFSAEGAIRSRAREEMGPHAALSSRGALVPSSVPATAARCRRARADVAVVAGRGRAKKSAAPLSKRKKAAAVAARTKPPADAVATPSRGGPFANETGNRTLDDILADIDAEPMEIVKPYRGDEEEDAARAPAAAGGGNWADALSEYREETASAERARNEARASVLAEEESFYEVGDGANIVEFGKGQAAVDDDDEDNDDEFLESDLERRYREGQAVGAVEFDLGVDDDEGSEYGWGDDGDAVRERGLPTEMRCFDTAKIYVKAGDGGRGMVAFRREAFVAQGGPFGGNGGNGGAIYFEADSSINSLVGFRKKVHHRADPGGNGGGKKMQGSIGADRTVLVPPGTIVRDAKTGRTLCEMFAHGHREMVLPGGRGGRGNASFKTAKNKAPQIAENGEEGMEKWVELELKLVADVGIIGVPNAGKSTLLANVSNAKPKIADYPFTTIVPNLGVVERDFERMVFADIPGLLEGASDGVGLGFEFLRHVKRTRVLVHVLDCTSEDVLEEYDAIRNELFLFDEEVGDKPELIALNKVDASDEAAERALELQTVFEERGLNVHVTSALTGAGVGELITAVKDIWASLPAIDYEAEAAERAAKKLARPADGKSLDEFTVTDTPYAFIIEGAAIERFVQMTNWDYFESFKRFARVLQMSGIEKAVNDAGAGEGDRVIIGKYEFEWSGDRREKTLFDSWRAKMDEKPAGTTQQGSRHWPH